MMGPTATVKADEFINAKNVYQQITRYVVYFSRCDQFCIHAFVSVYSHSEDALSVKEEDVPGARWDRSSAAV